MAYFETGSAADVNDLLGKLRTAMAANGWTIHYNDFAGSSGGLRCHASKGGVVVNLRTGFNNEVPVANSAERSGRQGAWSWGHSWYSGGTQFWRPSWLALNVGTGVDLAKSWHNQPGAPGSSEGKGLGAMITAPSAISRYWLFIHEDPDTVYLVAETRANKFEHLGFGKLLMAQEVESGGEWFSASRKMNAHYDGLIEPLYGNGQASASFSRLVDSRWSMADPLDGWNYSLMTPGAVTTWGNDFWASVGVPVLDQQNGNPHHSGVYTAITESYITSEGRSILHPVASWKGMPGGGYTLLGHVGHVARTSLLPYVAGDSINGVGETYLAFPGHHRLSPWSRFQYGERPSDPAGEVYNFYGVGVAVRRP